MKNRRETLIGIGSIGALSLAGCMDILREGVTATAELAIVDEDVVAEEGYEHMDTSDYTIDETVEVAGESRDVNVTNWVSTYSRDASEFSEGADHDEAVEDFMREEGVGFAVISTPSKSIVGQEVNPIGRMNNEELIEEFNDELGGTSVSELEHVGDVEVSVLGETVEMNEFEGVVETDSGDEVEVTLHVTERSHEDDIILGIGVYPSMLDEKEGVRTLTEGIVHPVEN